MEHLEKIHVPISQFSLGFSDAHKSYLNWDTFSNTWKMVDRGVTDPLSLPLFFSLSKYYSGWKEKKLKEEQEQFNFPTSDPVDIAYEWVKRHIDLYFSIKEQGYIPLRRDKPITVNVTKNGALKLVDGNHTVSILRHLGYTHKLPARVNNRDGGWIQLKEALYEMYGEKLLYQPVDHPDMKEWRVDRDCEDRWNLIEKHLPDLTNTHVLDIGSNMGWFSFKLHEKGASVIGLDKNQARVKASKTFSKFHGYDSRKITFFPIPFEEFLEKNIVKPDWKEKIGFEVTFMLSLLHHYIRRDPQEAWDAVNLISEYSKALVLELGTNNLGLEWSPDLIVENSGYSGYMIIRQKERPIYLFE